MRCPISLLFCRLHSSSSPRVFPHRRKCLRVEMPPHLCVIWSHSPWKLPAPLVLGSPELDVVLQDSFTSSEGKVLQHWPAPPNITQVLPASFASYKGRFLLSYESSGQDVWKCSWLSQNTKEQTPCMKMQQCQSCRMLQVHDLAPTLQTVGKPRRNWMRSLKNTGQNTSKREGSFSWSCAQNKENP